MEKSLKNIIDTILDSAALKPMGRLEKAISGPTWLKLEAGSDLLDLLSSKPEYGNFDQHLQSLGNSSSSTELKDLADWLIERANSVGSTQAIDELNAYNNSHEVKVYEVMLLASVHIDSEYRFCNGVELIHAHTLPNQYIASNIINNSFNSVLPLPKVESVLMAPYNQEISHISNTEMNAGACSPNIPVNELEEARMCLALARPINYGIHAIGHGTVAPDELPFIQSLSGWSVFTFKHPPLSPAVIEIEMQLADHLLEKFGKLPYSLKSKLIIPIERLNGYSSGATLVDKAIDLRICLEAIFLDDGNKEQLSYRLALRAALFLGNNLAEKKEIMKLMKDAYNVTSTAVHTGKLSGKKVKLLPKSAAVAKQAIIKIINEGVVDWQEIELQV